MEKIQLNIFKPAFEQLMNSRIMELNRKILSWLFIGKTTSVHSIQHRNNGLKSVQRLHESIKFYL